VKSREALRPAHRANGGEPHKGDQAGRPIDPIAIPDKSTGQDLVPVSPLCDLDGAERNNVSNAQLCVIDGPTASAHDGLSQHNPSPTSEIVRLGQEAMARKRRVYDDWLAIAEALEVSRTDVMRALHTNQAHGRRYEKAMGEWLIANGFREINKSTRSRLLECLKHKVEIQAWRSRLTDAERFKVNHPDTVLRKWKAATVVPDLHAPPRVSPVQKLKDSVVTLQEQNDRMRREIERGGGDLWNAEDRAQDIAKVIFGKLSKSKAERVARAILKMVGGAS
jgi:hypothetical protein